MGWKYGKAQVCKGRLTGVLEGAARRKESDKADE